MFARDCPCGSGTAYDACCGPVHRQERPAATPEELMRSRYSAYAVGDVDHLFRTWHPRTRPEDLSIDPQLTWTGLEILEAEGDVVEFRAHWRSPHGEGVLHERSRFEQRAGRWVYVEGRLS
ncbi:MAG: SEC-C domain-containing protein [Nocardioidaceae bacterium]|nr:SEC-C domain-containing protein [Nocardioidaceae bacterium]